ncbi:AsmA family protein [Flavobacterium restrictum]|uniref:AsmA family protein n=1 Tax=Flavobacterium restrictum TaxID=2594428 RepID=A0A553DVG4_9FLAO|nr:AsmA family protein [Flavobacterium restrictum]TRX36660.1 AsmA family protein [Flavobacterium restrictum]
MSQFYATIKKKLSGLQVKKIAKKIAFFALGILALVLVIAGGLAVYVNQNKPKIMAALHAQINDNIIGKVSIGDIQYKFLVGFPNVTIAIKDVAIKDSLWAQHHHTFFKAKEIEVRLNVLKLIDHQVIIHKIVMNQATVDIFKAKNGLTNTAIFKPKSSQIKPKSDTKIEINEISCNEVVFISENQQRHKLFHFEVASLYAKMDYLQDHIKTNLSLTTLAKQMAFNQLHGSFIKDKIVQGNLLVDYAKKEDLISVLSQNFTIGNNPFDISGHFNLGKKNANYDLDIKTKILWREASGLLANNISSRLNLFDFKAPLQARCTIKGDMNAEGDPEIIATALLRDNELKAPDGTITNCNFDGKYTNNFVNGKGNDDANSAIVINAFSGKFQGIPVAIPLARITNFDKPLATGKFTAAFKMAQLNEFVNKDFVLFSNGNAKVNLDFAVDIVNYKINKPHFTGNVTVNDATIKYVNKNITLTRTAIQMDFTDTALHIQKIIFKDRYNTVFMKCDIANFLNLYYNDPEKMIINWRIYAPYINAKQFLAILSSKQQARTAPAKKAGSFSNSLREVLGKCKVTVDLKADKIKYEKLLATHAKATIVINNSHLDINNGFLQTAGGTIAYNAQLTPKNANYYVQSQAKVNQVEIGPFLAYFDNFGVTSFNPKSIKGRLNLTANLAVALNPAGDLIKNSLNGTVNFKVNNGALVDFAPIKKGWKFLFPFRDLDNITFSDLSANLNVNNRKVFINDFKISSSVLNFDVNGVYALEKGTNLKMDIPLRNPKDDLKITDKKERAEKRNRGIVLHLLATDDDQGGVKIKLIKGDKN